MKKHLSKALLFTITLALTALLAVFVATLFFESLVKYYAFASNHEMTIYDLSIMSSFTGGVFGVVISKFGAVMKFFNRKFDSLLTKGGSK